MSVIHVMGLSLCERLGDRMLVMMLNSGFRESLNLPHHLQTLVVNRPGFVRATIPALPSLRGRLPAQITDEQYLGWDLAGSLVRFGADNDSVPDGKDDPADRRAHPDPATLDFSDLHWVMSIQRAIPGATVRGEARVPGALSSALAEFRGGRLRGGTPRNGDDAMNIWEFTPQVRQAVTDTLDVVTETAPAIRIFYADGRTLRGEITISRDAELFLVNEATPRDNQKEVQRDGEGNVIGPRARHMSGYYEALDNIPREIQLPVPIGRIPRPGGPGGALGVRAFEGTFCIVMLA